MKFGPVAPKFAIGAILAHSLQLSSGRKIKKGVQLSTQDVDALIADGVAEITVARLEGGDVHEDDAAERLAQAIVPNAKDASLRISQPFTGRVNLIAVGAGVVHIDQAAIHAFNAVHPMITIATLPPFQQVGAGTMVATIKIISYAVGEGDVAQAQSVARGAISVAPPVMQNAALLVTDIKGGPDNTKGINVIQTRVEALDMTLSEVRIVPHEVAALSKAIETVDADLVLILTASATSDAFDTAPEALRQAGGMVHRFGMPVDPGNLLFVGECDRRAVIGLPGCARSPALNGADWVLSRVVCGASVRDVDISRMGVGGLLKEIPTRPQPRGLRPSRRASGERITSE